MESLRPTVLEDECISEFQAPFPAQGKSDRTLTRVLGGHYSPWLWGPEAVERIPPRAVFRSKPGNNTRQQAEPKEITISRVIADDW